MRKLFRLIVLALILTGIHLYRGGTHVIPLQTIYQNPELPNGCEVTSLDMVLNYHGYLISKTKLASKYLKKGPLIGGDPNKEYLGDPFGKGFYCYEGPIVDAANKYLNNIGVSLRARDVRYAFIYRLRHYIKNNDPVIVWYTVDGEKPRESSASWKLEGKDFKPLANSHCMVLKGYDPTGFYVADPVNGEKRIGILEFLKIYMRMGMRAVVID